MAAYYLDTSSMAKRYIRESGTGWIQQITDPAIGNELLTIELAGPELISAIVRRSRTGHLSATDAAQALSAIRSEWRILCIVLEVRQSVITSAMDLAERHGLRGYDAVHLAAALVVHRDRRAQGLAPLTFVSADQEQLHAAAAEGLLIDDPNQHP